MVTVCGIAALAFVSAAVAAAPGSFRGLDESIEKFAQDMKPDKNAGAQSQPTHNTEDPPPTLLQRITLSMNAKGITFSHVTTNTCTTKCLRDNDAELKAACKGPGDWTSEHYKAKPQCFAAFMATCGKCVPIQRDWQKTSEAKARERSRRKTALSSATKPVPCKSSTPVPPSASKVTKTGLWLLPCSQTANPMMACVVDGSAPVSYGWGGYGWGWPTGIWGEGVDVHTWDGHEAHLPAPFLPQPLPFPCTAAAPGVDIQLSTSSPADKIAHEAQRAEDDAEAAREAADEAYEEAEAEQHSTHAPNPPAMNNLDDAAVTDGSPHLMPGLYPNI